MMSNTISSFPAIAGSAILSGLGRSAWWLARKYAATPVTSTALAAFTIGLGMAASNALFGQTGHHPAPLFFDGPEVAQQASLEAPAPVAPVRIAPAPVRPTVTQQVVQTPVAEVPPVVETPIASGDEVTNAELAEAQRRLQAMGLFSGEVDGYYGPKTAEAIRAFEMRNGMTPKGDMSRPVIEAILRAESSDHASIDAARTTARAAEAATPAVVEPLATITPDAPEAAPGQQALAALIAPSETVVASANGLAPVVTPEPEVAATPVAAAPVVEAAPNPAADAELIGKIQKGLASLGFLHGRIDGVIGEETARAIRNFEVFNNYEVTGRVSPELVDLLVAAGAEI